MRLYVVTNGSLIATTFVVADNIVTNEPVCSSGTIVKEKREQASERERVKKCGESKNVKCTSSYSTTGV